MLQTFFFCFSRVSEMWVRSPHISDGAVLQIEGPRSIRRGLGSSRKEGSHIGETFGHWHVGSATLVTCM
jgi:hypothetical protein